MTSAVCTDLKKVPTLIDYWGVFNNGYVQMQEVNNVSRED